MKERRINWSAGLCNASILLYVIWLMLPTVQTTGRAVSGVAAVALFVAGVALVLQARPVNQPNHRHNQRISIHTEQPGN